MSGKIVPVSEIEESKPVDRDYARIAKVLRAAREGVPTTKLDLAEVRDPPPEAFAWGTYFALGKFGIFFGRTHSGKTSTAAGLAFHLAAGGGSYCGLPLPEPPWRKGGALAEGHAVLVYTAEEGREDWLRKAGAQLLDWTAQVGEELAEKMIGRALLNLYLTDRSGQVTRLSELVQVRTAGGGEAVTRRTPRPTEERERLLRTAEAIEPTLVLVETALHLVDSPDNADFAGLADALVDVARVGGSAVVLTHHPTKAAGRSDGELEIEDALGGYALAAAAKGGIVSLRQASRDEAAKMAPHCAPDDVVALEHLKGTPSTPRGRPRFLVRIGYLGRGAVMRAVEDVEATPELKAAQEARSAESKRRDDLFMLKIYGVVEKRIADGLPTTKNALRIPLREAGIPGRNETLDRHVERAVEQGYLLVSKVSGTARHLALGRRPEPFQVVEGLEEVVKRW